MTSQDDDDRAGPLGASPQDAELPRRIGRYVVRGLLGRGGMGTVLEAFDATLDRRVALKVLYRDLSERRQQRLVREAKALAQLSHPNVVQIYEADQSEGQWFIAMEYIRGKTLQGWVEDLGAPTEWGQHWRQSVAMFVEAARGLAAAHAVGLVLRDFKPANALVGEDGRVRVLDFGLARARRAPRGQPGDGAEEGSAEGSSAILPIEFDDVQEGSQEAMSLSAVLARVAAVDQTLTMDGAIMGTPAYIAPEQVMGKPANAASDQYSFCVALHWALHGVRPLWGSKSSTSEASSRNAAVPAWLDAAVLRGLSLEPEERWPSMEALIEALLDDPAIRRRRRIALLGTGLVVVSAGAGLWIHEQREQARCEAAGEVVLEDWDPAAHEAMREAFGATALPFAEDTVARIEPELDQWVQRWSAARTEACLEARSDREDDRLRELCLERQRWQLQSTAEVLAQADPGVVMQAVTMVSELPRIAACDEPGSLRAVAIDTRGDGSRQTRQEVRRQLAQVVIDERAGRSDLALDGARRAEELAIELGDELLKAEALHQLGLVQLERGEFASAKEVLHEAYYLAGGAGHDPLALQIAIALTGTVGGRLANPDEGLEWAAQARMMMQRLGQSPEEADAQYFHGLGILHFAAGAYQEAADAYEQERRRQEELRGSEHPGLANALSHIGSAKRMLGDYEGAMEPSRRALELAKRTLGPTHPEVATMLNNIGLVEASQGNFEAAVANHRQAGTIQRDAFGLTSAKLATTLSLEGAVQRELGHTEEAVRLQERALAMAQATLGPHHPETAVFHSDLGHAYSRIGRLDEAEAQHRKALEIREHMLGPEHPDLVGTLQGLILVLGSKGRAEESLGFLHRMLAIQKQALGLEHPNVAIILDEIGRAQTQLGRLDEALGSHRRALEIREQGLEQGHHLFANSYGYIGTILLEQGKPREAVQWHRRALAVREQAESKNPRLIAYCLWNIGLALLAAGELDEAMVEMQRARSIVEGEGSDAVDMAFMLVGIGRLQLAEGQAAEAAKSFGEALELREHNGAPRFATEARFWLAQALWESGGDRQRALELARRAREEFTELGAAGHQDLREVTEWLAARAPEG